MLRSDNILLEIVGEQLSGACLLPLFGYLLGLVVVLVLFGWPVVVGGVSFEVVGDGVGEFDHEASVVLLEGGGRVGSGGAGLVLFEEGVP